MMWLEHNSRHITAFGSSAEVQQYARLRNSRLIQMRSCDANVGSAITCSEPVVGWCGVLVSPDCGLARKPGMGGLGMLLVSVELAQALNRHQSDQTEPP